MDVKLKPCPFCGNQPEVGVEFYESCGSEVKLRAEVWCERCKVGIAKIFTATEITLVPFDRYIDAFDSVVSKWNTRAEDTDGCSNIKSKDKI